ncbi:hypothetical protein BDN70DRAFT_977568 [Pholiota conissans]|uniref:Uncharacterized protein n=1 Tax=Pholiota conissans TaxID=109636 RepID=A0A9P5ZDH9_9AGAR|nr:hypothetical protein BDN70DRAFT_977568 [Pholiota conissans]
MQCALDPGQGRFAKVASHTWTATCANTALAIVEFTAHTQTLNSKSPQAAEHIQAMSGQVSIELAIGGDPKRCYFPMRVHCECGVINRPRAGTHAGKYVLGIPALSVLKSGYGGGDKLGGGRWVETSFGALERVIHDSRWDAFFLMDIALALALALASMGSERIRTLERMLFGVGAMDDGVKRSRVVMRRASESIREVIDSAGWECGFGFGFGWGWVWSQLGNGELGSGELGVGRKQVIYIPESDFSKPKAKER